MNFGLISGVWGHFCEKVDSFAGNVANLLALRFVNVSSSTALQIPLQIVHFMRPFCSWGQCGQCLDHVTKVLVYGLRWITNFSMFVLEVRQYIPSPPKKNGKICRWTSTNLFQENLENCRLLEESGEFLGSCCDLLARANCPRTMFWNVDSCHGLPQVSAWAHALPWGEKTGVHGANQSSCTICIFLQGKNRASKWLATFGKGWVWKWWAEFKVGV